MPTHCKTVINHGLSGKTPMNKTKYNYLKV